MRRLLNFLLILVVVGAVGFLLVKARVIGPQARRAPAQSAPTAAPVPARTSLRVSVAGRPEILLAQGMKQLLSLKADKSAMTMELVEFDPQTSWMELAAGELDLIIAPLGEAVTAQARFGGGRILFISGRSEGYDTVISRSEKDTPPRTLGISGGLSAQVLAHELFPEARPMTADSQGQLRAWLDQGAVEAALLESAGLSGELLTRGHRLGGTSAQRPMPSVVVLSGTLAEESAQNGSRMETLKAALEAWNVLIGYYTGKPALFRSTLRAEAQQLGLDLDRVEADYRFLTLAEGRQSLLQEREKGTLKQILELLGLAKIANLTDPDWDQTLLLPPTLEPLFLSTEPVANSPSPTPAASVSPTPSETSTTSPPAEAPAFLGTHHIAGPALTTPWPKAQSSTVSKTEPRPAVLTRNRVGIATGEGFVCTDLKGKVVSQSNEGGPPVASLVSDTSIFYVTRATKVDALDEEGTLLWSYPFEGEAGASPLLVENRLVMSLVSAEAPKLLALDCETGKPVWETPLTAAPSAPPAYANSPQPTVLLADASGQLSAWDAASGASRWRVSLPKPTTLAPASLNDLVAVSDPSGGISLLSAVDGKSLWNTELGSPIAFSPTVTKQAVLVVAKDQTVYALGHPSGDILGKASLPGSPSTPLLVVADQAYLGDDNGAIHRLSTQPTLQLEESQTVSQGGILTPAFSLQHYAVLSTAGELLIYSR